MDGRTPRTVLIVDDHEESVDVYGTYLAKQGYRVLVARNGDQARGILSSDRPHLVLLDRKLPDMDGLELLSDFDDGLRVVCVTARAFQEDRKEALDAGVDEYLVKPVPPKRVLQAVESLIGPPAGGTWPA